MHTNRQRPLHPPFHRQEPRPAFAAAHDMLVMSPRPDLTPGFPTGLAHPSAPLPAGSLPLRRGLSSDV